MDGLTPPPDLRRSKVASIGAMLEEYEELLPYLTYAERAELDALLAGVHIPIWEAFEGPQMDALNCQADELFYGGAAGGGKTDLLLGSAITRHWRSIIFRREYAELKGIRERAEELFDPIGKFNGQQEIWRINKGEFNGKRVEFGAVQYEGDERKFQGRAHDFKGFDEITQFTESQYRFLITWNRSVHRGQRVRVVATGNPPVSAEGRWVVDYWGPWLSPTYGNPAKEGELRWFVTGPDGKDLEVPGPESYELIMEDGSHEWVKPKSRTFIRALVEDNPRLMETGYRTILQNLPEPLRSRMLRGDFSIGTEDAEWQVIPTDWVIKAQARWAPTFEEYVLKRTRLRQEQINNLGANIAEAVASGIPIPNIGGSGVDLSQLIGNKNKPANGTGSDSGSAASTGPATPPLILPMPTPEEIAKEKALAIENGAVGVDVSRGGKDDTITSERLDKWFAALVKVPGKQTKDGRDVIQTLIRLGFQRRRIQIDVIGVGTSPVDIGKLFGDMNIIPMISSGRSYAKDRSGKLSFHNLRAEWWWRFREALDPTLGSDLALPPDPKILGDLTAPRWTLTAQGIRVEAKEHIKARIGKSTDSGDAIVLAHAVPYQAAEAYLTYMKGLVENAASSKKQEEQDEQDGPGPLQSWAEE